jgi:hypothetical protein
MIVIENDMLEKVDYASLKVSIFKEHGKHIDEDYKTKIN